eukprot:856318_1
MEVVEVGANLPLGAKPHVPPIMEGDDTPDKLAHSGFTVPELTWGLIGASIGHLLEWFDWSLFALLAVEIGANFFPSDNHVIEVLSTFAVFGCAFLVRPIGGSVLGYIGDKHGRVFALNISIYIMAVSSLLTGLLPNYHTIGIAAPILLTVLRLLQGLSVGAEGTGAVTYITEVCPPRQKAWYIAMIHLAGSGHIFGSLFVGILRYTCTSQQVVAWAWRIPFLFGALVGVVGIWLRYGLKQSTEFLNKKLSGQTKDNPLRASFRTQKINLLTIVCHLAFGASSGYTIYVWLPSYLLTKPINPIKNIYLINSLALIGGKASHVMSALIIDKYFQSDPSVFLIVFGILAIIQIFVTFPFFSMVNTLQITCINVSFAILDGIYGGGWSLWAISRLKDTVTRYSSYGFAYNVSIALFGGTAPFLAQLLIYKYDTFAVGLLLCVTGAISITTNIIWYYVDGRARQKFEKIEEMLEDEQMGLTELSGSERDLSM